MPTEVTVTDQLTWRELLTGLGKDMFDDATLEQLSNYYGVNHTGLTHDELAVRLYEFVIENTPNDMSKVAIWPLEPETAPAEVVEVTTETKVKKTKVKSMDDLTESDKLKGTVGLCVLISVISLLFALFGDDNGDVSQENVTTAIENERTRVGYDITDGNLSITPGGPLEGKIRCFVRSAVVSEIEEIPLNIASCNNVN
ncbi:MAG TPA: hypothetical protein VNA13_03735 [Xanthomonadales bacterium]|nr:hypothetical protein [Xanthomonadales bacterium]